MLFFLFLIVLGLIFLIVLGLIIIFVEYKERLNKANNIYAQARKVEGMDTGDPYDLTKLKEAFALYEKCQKLVNNYSYIKSANQCQKKIDTRKRFQYLLSIGRKKARKSYFREALQDFTEAKTLFNISELEGEISKCQDGIKPQENYEAGFKKSAQIARKGKFQEAIDLLKPTLDRFSREDGQQLLSKIQQVISAKELYKSGLSAENTNKFHIAISKYEQALNLLPEFIECKIRLGAITVTANPNKAISYLEGIEKEQAAYIRGFAYAQLGNWQEANREWRSIEHSVITSQREILKSLAERDRLSQIKEIELAVDHNNIEIAKTLSLEFINKFGSEPTIEQNLENHIQPLLEHQVWEAQDWQQITAKTEQIWLEQQEINSLHNWAIASYYSFQTDSSKLANFIIAWLTALANIEQNPTLQNVFWLRSNSVDIKDVSAKLKQILENAIDAVKDDDIEEYLKLRDIYRRDMVTLSLIQQNNCGMRIKQELFILPGCYQGFGDRFPRVKFPAKVWGALYTDWGLAVAACHEGDVARAIKIKPTKNPSFDVDNFADCFVSFHEGCYYLQNLEWRKAINPLQQAQSDIKAKSDWCKEIDRLCELQRKKIKNFDEHLQFSKFWYELIATQPSRSYFAECKARKVAEKLSNETISYQQGLKELQKIKDIDPNNSVTLNLIETIEIDLELQEIDRLWQQSLYEEAVRRAKRSLHEQVRFKVAEVCVDILLKGAQSGNLPFEVMHQLGQWTYELCPREPAFMPIYSKLGIY